MLRFRREIPPWPTSSPPCKPAAIRNVAIYAQSFLETTFRLTAEIAYDPAYLQTAVQAAILQTLGQTYSFAARTFGQGVSGDEVAALIQGVAGVVAVNVTTLRIVATSTAGDIGSAAYSVSSYNAWLAAALTQPLPRPCSGSATSICPYLPVATPGVLPLPAEILVLDPDPKKTRAAGADDMSHDLFELLPAVYRLRDGAAGGHRSSC